jgi:hypothetical protein
MSADITLPQFLFGSAANRLRQPFTRQDHRDDTGRLKGSARVELALAARRRRVVFLLPRPATGMCQTSVPYPDRLE